MPKNSDSNYDDFREIDRNEETEFINKKLNMLPIQKELSKLDSNKTQMDYDPTILYPSALWDEKSVYPKIDTGFGFRPHMNDIYVETFNNKTFNQDGNESGILIINYYNPPNLKFQHLAINEKVKNTEVNRSRNGNIIDTLTSVDMQEMVKVGGKVIEIYEGVI